MRASTVGGMGLALAQGRMPGRGGGVVVVVNAPRSSTQPIWNGILWINALVSHPLSGTAPRCVLQYLPALLRGIGPQLLKGITCSLMHIFLASFPPWSRSSMSPMVLPRSPLKQTVCAQILVSGSASGKLTPHSEAWAEGIPGRGNSIRKAQRYDRACLV